MDDNNTIKVKAYNSETSHNEETGQTISVYTLAKSLTLDNFASMLDDFLNLGGKGFREGKEVGLQLRFTHRTLQRLAVCFAFGLIAGLSEQEYTDPRNETAIQTAKKVVQLMETGELPVGLYI
ncbi:MAG: hypothetical protein A2030_08440 [Chloroflexi bacterium RBG_19FT_COMBO_50_10]|nr:MAG: hypothetical protein A2Y53_04690 [Chloroflexi bacterium RBG_16_47_49]OGO65088.1 MAG: hypothetical protein A2030_08440 [Chloroflexi bacterium RBG_19FT_COMBO_50_10]